MILSRVVYWGGPKIQRKLFMHQNLVHKKYYYNSISISADKLVQYFINLSMDDFTFICGFNDIIIKQNDNKTK